MSMSNLQQRFMTLDVCEAKQSFQAMSTRITRTRLGEIFTTSSSIASLLLVGLTTGLFSEIPVAQAQHYTQSCAGFQTTWGSNTVTLNGSDRENVGPVVVLPGDVIEVLVTTGNAMSTAVQAHYDLYNGSPTFINQIISGSGSVQGTTPVGVGGANQSVPITLSIETTPINTRAERDALVYTVRCLGGGSLSGSSGSGSSGSGSGSSGTSTPDQALSVESAIGAGRDYILTHIQQSSGVRNWIPIHDGPSYWNGNTGRFNNRPWRGNGGPANELEASQRMLSDLKVERTRLSSSFILGWEPPFKAELESKSNEELRELLELHGFFDTEDSIFRSDIFETAEDSSTLGMIRSVAIQSLSETLADKRVAELNVEIARLEGQIADYKRQQAIANGEIIHVTQTRTLQNSGPSNNVFNSPHPLNPFSPLHNLSEYQNSSGSVVALLDETVFAPFNFSDSHARFAMTLDELRAFRRQQARLKNAEVGSRIANAFFATRRTEAPEQPLPGLLGDKRFNGWIDASASWSNDDRSGNQSSSDAFRVRAGASYQLLQHVGFGAMVRYSHQSSKRDDGTSKSEGSGFGGSLFARLALPYGAVLTPVVAYERIDTDMTATSANSSSSVTGGFQSDLVTLGGTLNRRFVVPQQENNRAFFVDPNLTLSHVIAKRHGYSRSNGSYVPSDWIEQGSLSFRPSFGVQIFDITDNIDMIQPTFGLSGVWNYQTPSSYTTTSGSVIKPTEWFASVSAGLTIQLKNGLTSTISGSYSGLGTKVNTGTLSGRLSMPF